MSTRKTRVGSKSGTQVPDVMDGVRRLVVRKLPSGGFRAELTMRRNAGVGRPTANAATGAQAIVDVMEGLAEQAANK